LLTSTTMIESHSNSFIWRLFGIISTRPFRCTILIPLISQFKEKGISHQKSQIKCLSIQPIEFAITPAGTPNPDLLKYYESQLERYSDTKYLLEETRERLCEKLLTEAGIATYDISNLLLPGLD
jgi:hypothetical protein